MFSGDLCEISFLDLYQYLFESPSEFMRESLKAFNLLEAYNFYMSGQAQDTVTLLHRQLQLFS